VWRCPNLPEVDATEVWSLVSPRYDDLNRLRRLSLRRRVFFKVLDPCQRRYFNAVLMTRIEMIRSKVVLRLLEPIVEKLLAALGRRNSTGRDDADNIALGALTLMGEAAYKIMRNVAEKIGSIAKSWGHKLADRWKEDTGFIKYLIVMNLPQNMNQAFTVRL